MWSPPFKSRKTAKCTHENVTTSNSYGLKRVVCRDCGNVSVEHLSDYLEGLLEQIVKEGEESQV